MLDVMDLGCYHPDPWSQEALCGCHLGDLQFDSGQSFLRTCFSVFMMDVLGILVLLEKCPYL